MYKLKAGLVGLLCLVSVAGCTTNTSIANTVFTTHATMQLSVGTLNDFSNILRSRVQHTTLAGSSAQVLAIATFRNQFGNSAFETPGSSTLTLPDSTVLSTSSQFYYGQSVGNNGLLGLPPAFQFPFSQSGSPCISTLAAPNGFGYRQCFETGYLYQLGAATTSGRDTLGNVPAGGGTYTLATTVAVNGTTIPFSAAATLPALPAFLPNPCTNLTFVSDGLGGGTFTLTPAAPPGAITERVVVLRNHTSSVTDIIAEVEASGNTAVVPDTSPAFFNSTGGDDVTIIAGLHTAFCIGTDFPWVEDGQPNNTSSAPNLTNGINGTSNMSVSGSFNFTE